jgi:hypothetical protein
VRGGGSLLWGGGGGEAIDETHGDITEGQGGREWAHDEGKRASEERLRCGIHWGQASRFIGLGEGAEAVVKAVAGQSYAAVVNGN